MTEFTANFRFPIPDFNQEPWHDSIEESFRSIDTAIHDALVAQDIDLWENSTAYIIGDIVVDPADGSIWVAAVAHTSPATPTTFASERGSNPTRWNSPTHLSTNRGNWITATGYIVGDFVVNAARYAVCIVSHVSTVFNTDLAAGKWAVLIDLSTLGVGINALPEESIASAATTDIGSKSATRVSVSGTATVTSFGLVADTFKILRFTVDGATVTHHATDLILLGGATRIMRTGDIMWVASNSSQKWREIGFFRGDGRPATDIERGIIELATTAEAQAGSDTVRAMTPATTKALIYALFIPAATAVVFWQAAAPTGWTKQTTHNDKTIKIVSGTGGGSGGTSPFSTVFGKTQADSHTLSSAEVPATAISGTAAAQGTTTAVRGVSTLSGTPGAGQSSESHGYAVQQADKTGDDGALVVTAASAVSGSVSGSGGGHVHPMDIRVQYLECIICTKDA